MATSYQSIFDMTQATSVRANDKLLLARGDTTYYQTYSVLYDSLSNLIFDDFTKAAFQLSVVSNESELAASLTDKALGANIGYALKTRIENLNSTSVKLTGNQTINGVKTFGSSPRIPDTTTANAAVNYQTLTRYVANNTPQLPLFSTAIIDDRANFTTFVSRMCPTWQLDTFPASITIVCHFYSSYTSNKTPKFKVYNTIGTDTEISTTLYGGTATINASTAASNKNEHYAKYYCVVSGIAGNKIKIVIDSLTSSIDTYLNIFPGSITSW